MTISRARCLTKNSLAASTHEYAQNSTVNLTASPMPGYTFTGWSGDATGASESYNLLMDGNKSVNATFTADGGGGSTYTLNIS